MANLMAWSDRDKVLAILNSMDIYLRSFGTTFESLKGVKEEILDNSERASELQKIINEDPVWTMKKLRDKYLYYKEIYEYLVLNNYI